MPFEVHDVIFRVQGFVTSLPMNCATGADVPERDRGAPADEGEKIARTAPRAAGGRGETPTHPIRIAPVAAQKEVGLALPSDRSSESNRGREGSML